MTLFIAMMQPSMGWARTSRGVETKHSVNSSESFFVFTTIRNDSYYSGVFTRNPARFDFLAGIVDKIFTV